MNPDFAPTLKSDKYDIKVTARLGEKHELSGFFHDEIYEYPGTTSQFVTEAANGNEIGRQSGMGCFTDYNARLKICCLN